MTLVLTTGLRLALWGLLTGDPGVLNLSIGLAVALLLPRSRRPLPLGAFWTALGQALAAIPQAYGEAFQLLLARRHRQRIVHEPSRAQGSSAVITLEIVRISLTPFTVVLGLEPGSHQYRVHERVPGERP
jgi:multicomponent Na+:H+ antiporter subunit E